MEINPTTLAALQKVAIISSNVRPGLLQTGQSLPATVVAVNPDQTISLHIGNAILNARTALPLSEGQNIQIYVEQGGEKPLIKFDSQTIRNTLIQFIQRHNVASQQPIQLTLATLEWLNKNESSVKQQQLIPPQLQQAIRKLHNALPNIKDLGKMENVRQAISSSGQFLEKRLLERVLQIQQYPASKTSIADNENIRQHITQDFKAHLFRLIKLAEGLKPATTPVSSGNQSTTSLPVNIQQALTNIQTMLKQTTDPAEIEKLNRQVSQLLDRTNGGHNSITNNTLKTTQPSDSKVLIPKFIIQIFSNMSQLGRHRLMPANSSQRAYELLNALIEQLKNQTASSTSAAGQKPSYTAGPPPLPGQHMQPQTRIKPDSKILSRETQWLSRLQTEFKSAISRIQLQQSSNLVEKDQTQMITSMEIPYRDNDEYRVLGLRIMEESHTHSEKETEEEKTWSVILNLELQPLGPLCIKISWFQEKISVFIWATKPATHQQIQTEINNLKSQLGEQGLETDKLSCTQGQPPIDFRHKPSTGMIDFKA